MKHVRSHSTTHHRIDEWETIQYAATIGSSFEVMFSDFLHFSLLIPCFSLCRLLSLALVALAVIFFTAHTESSPIMHQVTTTYKYIREIKQLTTSIRLDQATTSRYEDGTCHRTALTAGVEDSNSSIKMWPEENVYLSSASSACSLIRATLRFCM